MLDIEKLSTEPAVSVSDGVGSSCAVPGGKSGASWRGEEPDEAASADVPRTMRDDGSKERAYVESRNRDRIEKGVLLEQEALEREYEVFLNSGSAKETSPDSFDSDNTVAERSATRGEE